MKFVNSDLCPGGVARGIPADLCPGGVARGIPADLCPGGVARGIPADLCPGGVARGIPADLCPGGVARGIPADQSLLKICCTFPDLGRQHLQYLGVWLHGKLAGCQSHFLVCVQVFWRRRRKWKTTRVTRS